MNFPRIRLLLAFFLFIGLIIVARLYYWQILSAAKLQTLAKEQHVVRMEVPSARGEIYTSDDFPLVLNQTRYLLFANLPQLSQRPLEVAQKLGSILLEEEKTASPSGKFPDQLRTIEEELTTKMNTDELAWVALKHHLSPQSKKEIENLNIEGLGFEEENLRSYPEASLSAHLLGFLGVDYHGQPLGYFGLEGFYDLELKGQPGLLFQERDVQGKPILVGDFYQREPKKGRDLFLSLDRALQFMIERKLSSALKKYGAASGSVIVLRPEGAVLAMASFPSYEADRYFQSAKETFPNPVISSSFEPGSVLKPVVMAAALNEGVITPQSRCQRCEGPLQIGPHLIRTWDDQYYPDCTVREIIQHSDNVGMVFVAEKLGTKKLVEYLKKFGFGQKTEIDLQEESTPRLRAEEDWREIDRATAAFGQGIAVTPIQLVRAIAVIANGGQLVKPFVVQKIVDGKKEIDIQNQVIRRVISRESAAEVKEMMVGAVEKGEAKWAKLPDFKIAGKTGTAQIPIAGHYDEEKTIASFVGFAPADNPEFVMLIILRQPQSSPWASETAAPLWFDIAKDLLYYFQRLPK